jgi:hypothetical protein
LLTSLHTAHASANSDPEELRQRAEAAQEEEIVINLLEQKRKNVREVRP